MAVVRLMRPRQWTKNLLVLAALVFARRYGSPDDVLAAARMLVAFCFASSAVYVLNDLLDREADRRHPVRRRRPVASGEVSVAFAGLVAPVLGLLALLIARDLPPGSGSVVVAYLLLGVVYSLLLRRVVIADVLAVAVGFVLRSAAGAVALSVEISPWLLLCTMLLALFLAVAKRRQELVAVPAAWRARPVLREYTAPLLDQMLGVAATGTLVGYLLYSLSEQTARKFPSGLMPVTSLFVLYGLLRYLHLVLVRGEGGEPEAVLLRDRPLQAALALYLLSVFLAVRA
jgi:4-hydroxybenzoate polyprenyltransferase